MSAHIVCLTAGGGVPIFTRHKGNTESLPFSIIGSLNGVHMFSKSHNMELMSTVTEDFSFVWKEFSDSVILIAAASGCTITVLEKLLESAFNAMILIVGIDEIKSQRNVERLKRELRVCYPIIDRLLDSLDYGDSNNKHSSDLVQLVECVLCPENNQIQVVLNSYTECIDSMYSCVLIHGKIAVATENWWSLTPDELKLLSLLAAIENTSSSKDIPVFLPNKSPNAAFRFVACTLIPDVQVCCLCGPTPVLEEVEHSASHCFKNSLEILGEAVRCHPKNFSNDLQLDSSILGLLLVNTKFGKYMISKSPQQATGKRTASGSHRLDILRSFYYQAVFNALITSEDTKEEEAGGDRKSSSDKKENVRRTSNVGSTAKETYWCSEYHKCHAAKVGDNILCVLYNSTIPIHAARSVTGKTLKTIISDKQICW